MKMATVVLKSKKLWQTSRQSISIGSFFSQDDKKCIVCAHSHGRTHGNKPHTNMYNVHVVYIIHLHLHEHIYIYMRTFSRRVVSFSCKHDTYYCEKSHKHEKRALPHFARTSSTFAFKLCDIL